MYLLVTRKGNYVKVWYKTTSIFDAISVKKKIRNENNFVKVTIKKNVIKWG